MDWILVLPVVFPMAAALFTKLFWAKYKEKGFRQIYTSAVLVIHLALTVSVSLQGDLRIILFKLTPNLPILMKSDGLGRFFVCLVSVIWLLVGIFSYEYMTHERKNEKFYFYYLLSLGVLSGLGFSGNFLTMYVMYEAMTFLAMPLILHNQTKKAISAALKYLFYSIFGASMALIGFFFIYEYGNSIEFIPGGVLDATKLAGNEGGFLAVIFLMLMGFGAKAGMFPLHGWLPAAHPEAPAPASAVLSGVFTKTGVLASIRVVFYLVGADFLRGTWVQYAWMSLALVTVFMGSMMAYKEKLLKKRLAYSTVSQVSYVIFGLSTLSVTGFTGALLHFAVHAVVKDLLFLAAGAVIYKTGCKYVGELRGIGKRMPVTMWCFAAASLALVGIPPTGGFVSKWFLAEASLNSGMSFLTWLGPTVLLISAVLTAGYLFPIVTGAFFPGADYDYSLAVKAEPSKLMTVPMVMLAAAAVLIGLLPGGLQALAGNIAAAL